MGNNNSDKEVLNAVFLLLIFIVGAIILRLLIEITARVIIPFAIKCYIRFRDWLRRKRTERMVNRARTSETLA